MAGRVPGRGAAAGKVQPARGGSAFDKALVMKPRPPRLVGKGLAAMQKLEIKEADGFADQALKINPRLPDRRCGSRAMSGWPAATSPRRSWPTPRRRGPSTRAMRTRWPASPPACTSKRRTIRRRRQGGRENNPKAAVFYCELAELEEPPLLRRRREVLSEGDRAAAEAAGRPNTLGMLYMRLGREEEAAPLLDKGFDSDKFNVRVANTLRVLNHLKKYDTLKTEHFIVRFDPKNDTVLAHFMADYLEEIYGDLADKFQFKPKGPILIEVFNVHEMFSGRVVALPDLHTVGACDRPACSRWCRRATRGCRKPFNWPACFAMSWCTSSTWSRRIT